MVYAASCESSPFFDTTRHKIKYEYYYACSVYARKDTADSESGQLKVGVYLYTSIPEIFYDICGSTHIYMGSTRSKKCLEKQGEQVQEVLRMISTDTIRMSHVFHANTCKGTFMKPFVYRMT